MILAQETDQSHQTPLLTEIEKITQDWQAIGRDPDADEIAEQARERVARRQRLTESGASIAWLR